MSHVIVKVIKFANNQEIIAKVVSGAEPFTDTTPLVVQSPLSLQPLRTGESSLSIGLMPFSWGGDNQVPIALNPAHILCVMVPESELQSQYLAALAGISVPQRSTPKLTLV